jgi:ribosomal protein S18 acetylase RimI-like enzyme
MAISASAHVHDSLWAALETFSWVPGARLVREADTTLVLTGMPYATFNNVIAADLPEKSARRRIPEILRAFVPDSLPVTWWVSDETRPTDLPEILTDLGLALQEPEFAMSIDLDRRIDEPALPPGGALEAVERPDQLEGWLAVMSAAFGWPDAGKADIFRSMYRAAPIGADGAAPIRHFVIVEDGRPVASSSLFTGGGAAFVTNIGTIPAARGRGLGTAATVATLMLAQSLGRRSATLTASVDGRGVYRRLGFVEAGVIDRYVADAAVVAAAGGAP